MTNQESTQPTRVTEERPEWVPTFVPWPTELNGPLRFKFFVTGVVFPLMCFGGLAFGMDSGSRSPWQSGSRLDHVIVLMRAPAFYAFLPLIAYSMVSCGLWCFEPQRWSQSMLVRLGLIAGSVLALMFCILLFIPTAFASQAIALFVAAVLAAFVFFGRALFRRQFSILYLVLLTTAVALILGFVLASDLDVEAAQWILSLAVSIIAASPTLAALTYMRCTRAAMYLNTKAEPSLPKAKTWQWIVAWVSWISGLLASWKIALEIEAIEYQKLPTTNPNCYVSSAAAFGHPSIVGAKWRGEVPVNTQMQRLKLLELALGLLSPWTHRRVRTLYNLLGPWLAACVMCSPWFADASYLVLKPIELLALSIQRGLGIDEEVVSRIYGPREEYDSVQTTNPNPKRKLSTSARLSLEE